MPFIDAHVHVWTDDFSHYPLAPGFNRANIRPTSFTPQELFRHAKPLGVDRFNLIQISFYGFDNRYMLDMIALEKDAFVGTAYIDVHQKEPEREMAGMARRGVRAFRIHPRLSGVPAARWLEPAGYDKMFQTGARLRLAMSCLIDPDGLPEVDRMCQRYPDTPVIIDHCCRLGIEGPMAERDLNALCGLAKHKEVMVKIGAFYALGKKQPPYGDMVPMIETIIKAFGARRCMWESDSPFQVVQHAYRDSLDLVRNRLPFLSAEDKDWLLRRTAEDFFFRNR